MKLIKLFICLIGIYLFMIPVNMVRFHYNFENSFWRTTLFLFEGTVWSPNFTETKFSKIKLGDSEEKVISILGEPLIIET